MFNTMIRYVEQYVMFMLFYCRRLPYMGMVICNYDTLGARGGHTCRFTVVSCHPNVCWRPCPRPSLPDFVYVSDISYSFSPMAFKLSDVVTMDKTLN